ncbi:MAG TPA: hypothetical protein VGP26_13115 [Actinophytocola sp.]|jgi:hypothetical protein|nr:hypothetical protein [Actinophytocola sp.]
MAGGRRVPPQTVSHAAVEHSQLKQWTDDADPATSQAFADEWTRTGSVLADAAESLKRAALGTEAGWAGEAADAMRARLGQIAAWSGGTGAQISGAGQTISRQSEAADAARRAMPEPVSYNPGDIIRDAPGNGLLALVALPQLIHQRYVESNAAHEEAVRVVSGRDNTMNSAAGQVSVFQAPPRLDGGDGREQGDGGPGAGKPDSGGPGGEPRPGRSGDGAPRHGEPGGTPGSGAPGAGAPGGGFGGGTPGGSGDEAPGGGAPAGITTPGAVTPREPVSVAGSTPSPGAAPGFGPIGGLGDLGGSGGSPGFGEGAGGLGGARGFGGGAGGGEGAGGRGAEGGGARGAGPGVGKAMPGSATAEAAAARGRGGSVGGLPMGGGARRDDDAEHRRPEFLQEPDPDGLFDSDVLTAPAVIGGPDDE